ncbi:MAG: hypothetical protein KF842_00980 [Caulobacter sp.]|nr:hypothetical protein [Caulobacter sp.]
MPGEETLGTEVAHTLSRLEGGHLFRAILASAAPFDHDYNLTVIYLAIVQANSAVDGQGGAGGVEGGDGQATTVQRRPVSVHALAGTLHMPYETTRRAVGRLIAAGFVRRVSRNGVIFNPDKLSEPALALGAEIAGPETLRFAEQQRRVGAGVATG